jgi:exonuclease III
LSEYAQKYDILLFSETRLQKIPQSKFQGYDIFSLKQKTPRHGLALMVKNGIFNFTKKLSAISPCVLWVLLGSSESNINFILGSVYIPGYDSKFADENDFDKISEDILTLKEKYNCPFILMGDFNSRTGNLTDSIDTKLCPATPRVNKDKKIDTYGRNLVKMCNNLNLKILNGSLGSDNGIGNFTCHKKNRNNLNQSVVDYCIVSECLVPCISDFCIDVFDRCMSDVHSPICLSIKNVQTIKNVQHLPEENCENILYKSVWKPESKTQYKNAFVENDIMQLSRDILSQQLSANPSKEEIGKLVTDLTSVIVNPAKKVGLCKKKSGKKDQAKKKPKSILV